MMVKLHTRGRIGILGFLVAGLLALTAGVLTGVGSASAHSPQIVANVDCDGVIHYTVTSWTTGISGENPDVLVYYKVENTGPAVVVTHGSFSAANGYQFSGTTPWPGAASLVVMYAEAVAPWADGAVTTGNYWTEWVRPSCSGTTTTAQETTTTAQETTTTAQETTTTAQETTTTAQETTTTAQETTTTAQETTTRLGDDDHHRLDRRDDHDRAGDHHLRGLERSDHDDRRHDHLGRLGRPDDHGSRLGIRAAPHGFGLDVGAAHRSRLRADRLLGRARHPAPPPRLTHLPIDTNEGPADARHRPVPRC